MSEVMDEHDREVIKNADLLRAMMKTEGWKMYEAWAQVKLDEYSKMLFGGEASDDGVTNVLNTWRAKGRVDATYTLLNFPSDMLAAAERIRAAEAEAGEAGEEIEDE